MVVLVSRFLCKAVLPCIGTKYNVSCRTCRVCIVCIHSYIKKIYRVPRCCGVAVLRCYVCSLVLWVDPTTCSCVALAEQVVGLTPSIMFLNKKDIQSVQVLWCCGVMVLRL